MTKGKVSITIEVQHREDEGSDVADGVLRPITATAVSEVLLRAAEAGAFEDNIKYGVEDFALFCEDLSESLPYGDFQDLVEALQVCHDEADHILGTEADDPLEIARVNARRIKEVTRTVLKKVGGS